VTRALIIGTGLIGGSVAAGLRAAGWRVTGCDERAAARALERGLVDEIGGLDSARAVDAVVLAVPVGATPGVLAQLAPHLARETVVTDVGSTKLGVLAAAASLPWPSRFVGGHPLAGTERSGPDAADARLFAGRRCLLTPGGADADAVALVENLWRALGAEVSSMTAAEHDQLLAAVSHLPHAVAFALAAAAGSALAGLGDVAGLHGAGFVDTTRIASSDGVMWRDIFLANRAPLLDALDRFEDELARLRAAVALGDVDGIAAAVERAHAGRRRVLG
jgi:prephenate dehydrogenase